jgi:hypothetical protein
VGSIRRECLDHAIVRKRRSLRRTLRCYLAYHEHSRTHLALAKAAAEPRHVFLPARDRWSSMNVARGIRTDADRGMTHVIFLAMVRLPGDFRVSEITLGLL